MSLLMLELPSPTPGDHEGPAEPLDALAGMIRTAVGEHGALARYADRRLAVILAETDLPAAIARAERIGHTRSSRDATAGDVTPAVPAIGVAQFHDDESLNHLIERVAEALARARAERTLIAVADRRVRRRPARPLCAMAEGACLCGLCGQ